MKTSITTFIDFVSQNAEFFIPYYQRNYSWDKENCELLWEDILQASQNQNSHFMGTLVCKKRPDNNNDSIYEIIDGQQRLTTLFLLGLAIVNNNNSVDWIGGNDIPIKLKLSDVNHTTLEYIYNLVFQQQNIDVQDGISTHRLYRNFQYYQNKFINLRRDKNQIISNILSGIEKLQINVLELDDIDDSQTVFERFNSAGKPLEQSDLVRNYLMMYYDEDKQKQIDRIWGRIEGNCTIANNNKTSVLLKDYIIYKYYTVTNEKRIYERFKQRFPILPSQNEEEEKLSFENTLKILGEIEQISNLFKELNIIECDESVNRNNAFSNMKVLYMLSGKSFPFLIKLWSRYGNIQINQDNKNENTIIESEIIEICQLLESYLYRRYICSCVTNEYINTFKNLCWQQNIDYLFIKDYLLQGIDDKTIFPDDNQCQTKTINPNPQARYKKYYEYVGIAIDTLPHITVQDILTSYPYPPITQWTEILTNTKIQFSHLRIVYNNNEIWQGNTTSWAAAYRNVLQVVYELKRDATWMTGLQNTIYAQNVIVMTNGNFPQPNRNFQITATGCPPLYANSHGDAESLLDKIQQIQTALGIGNLQIYYA